MKKKILKQDKIFKKKKKSHCMWQEDMRER